VRPSIVLIRGRYSEGTGFVFHSPRHIATAFHVVSNTSSPRVILWDGRILSARVVAWDADWDIALLELPQALDVPVLAPVSRGNGQVGDPVAAVGNPWGAEERKQPGSNAPVWALSQGVISAPPGDLIQTDAPVNPGNSGGPLLTQDAEVVGVLVVRVEGSDGISFAVSGQRLIALANDRARRDPYAGPASHTDVQLAWVPWAEHELVGVLGGLRFRGADWGVAVRGARLWGDTEVVSTLRLTERDRWLLETEGFIELFSGADTALPIGLGVAAQLDDVFERTATVESGALLEASSRSKRWDVRPMVSIGLRADLLMLDTAIYAFGRFGLGARFGVALVF
jgi:hypothetical protein